MHAAKCGSLPLLGANACRPLGHSRMGLSGPTTASVYSSFIAKSLGRNILANRQKSNGGVCQRQKSGSPEEIIAVHFALRKKKNCWAFPKGILNPALLFGMQSKNRKKSAASAMRFWAVQLIAKCWLGPSRLGCATFSCPFADAGVEQSSSGLWRTMCRRGTLQS